MAFIGKAIAITQGEVLSVFGKNDLAFRCCYFQSCIFRNTNE
jgi:hypothetical protein